MMELSILIGEDQTGKTVPVTLNSEHAAMCILGAYGSGKEMLLRNIIVQLCQLKNVEINLFDFKGIEKYDYLQEASCLKKAGSGNTRSFKIQVIRYIEKLFEERVNKGVCRSVVILDGCEELFNETGLSDNVLEEILKKGKEAGILFIIALHQMNNIPQSVFSLFDIKILLKNSGGKNDRNNSEILRQSREIKRGNGILIKQSAPEPILFRIHFMDTEECFDNLDKCGQV